MVQTKYILIMNHLQKRKKENYKMSESKVELVKKFTMGCKRESLWHNLHSETPIIFSYFACSIDWEIGRTRESMDDTRPDPEEGWPL